ncbi:MAG: LysM peptidoglycan-binding domain-containing protein [Pseudomonadota bacterium]
MFRAILGGVTGGATLALVFLVYGKWDAFGLVEPGRIVPPQRQVESPGAAAEPVTVAAPAGVAAEVGEGEAEPGVTHAGGLSNGAPDAAAPHLAAISQEPTQSRAPAGPALQPLAKSVPLTGPGIDGHGAGTKGTALAAALELIALAPVGALAPPDGAPALPAIRTPEPIDADKAALTETEADDEAEPNTVTEGELPPAFDVVRVNASGETVIAGRASPGAVVEVLLDDDVVSSVKADRRGVFIALVSLGTSAKARSLYLRSKRQRPLSEERQPAGEDAVRSVSEEKLAALSLAEPPATAAPDEIRAPRGEGGNPAPRTDPAAADPARPEADPAPAAGGPGAAPAETASNAQVPAPRPRPVRAPTTSSAETGEVRAPTAETASGPVLPQTALAAAQEASAPTAADDQALPEEQVLAQVPAPGTYFVSAPIVILPVTGGEAAPLLVQPDEAELSLLQTRDAAEGLPGLLLQRITYAPGGDVIASGQAKPHHLVRIYANAAPVAEAKAGDSGAWEASIPERLAAETLLFRMDEIAPDGRVTARVEAPFTYAAGESDLVVNEREITVVRGDNLWTFAEQYYGRGIRYSVIFEANANLIRDPDLIYPGQIFTVPELVATE